MSNATQDKAHHQVKKAGQKRALNAIYASPLPCIVESTAQTAHSSKILSALWNHKTWFSNPHCQGFFDPSTKSVWITNSKDSQILWRRGFFGKGNLSRSEPTWQSRQEAEARAKGKGMRGVLLFCFVFADSLQTLLLKISSPADVLTGSNSSATELQPLLQRPQQPRLHLRKARM